jgi:hypothetical protein
LNRALADAGDSDRSADTLDAPAAPDDIGATADADHSAGTLADAADVITGNTASAKAAVTLSLHSC